MNVRVGEVLKNHTYTLFSTLCILWKAFSLISHLKELIYFNESAKFNSEDMLFQIVGSKEDWHFLSALFFGEVERLIYGSICYEFSLIMYALKIEAHF